MASSSSSSPEYAGFWQRAVAFLIDWLIVVVIFGPCIVVLFGQTDFSFELSLRSSWQFASTLVVALAVLIFWRYRGATPGKMAIAVRIVDAQTGRAPSTGRLILRLIGYLVSALPLYLGFLWVAFDRRKQAWHDKIAGTVVIVEDD